MSVDFSSISPALVDAAAMGKALLAALGTPVEFIEQGSASGRTVRVVIYRDVFANPLLADADSNPGTALLNPDEFSTPHRAPQKFDRLKVSTAGFARTYTIDSVSPILAGDSLPLLLAQLVAN